MNNPFEIIEQRLGRIEFLLVDLKGHSTDPANDPANDRLNVTQAAELLDVTTPTIYGLVYKRIIPHSKRGKRLYFSKAELLAWIKEGRRKTMAEAGQDPEQHLKPMKQRKGATA